MRFFLVLFLAEISFSGFSQTPLLDSLYTALGNHSAEDTVRVKTLLKICFQEIAYHPEKNKTLAEEALKISSKINFTRGIGNAHRYIAEYYKEIGDHPTAIRHTFQMLNAFESIRFNVGVSQSYQLLGLLYDAARDFEKAGIYYRKAVTVAQRANLKKELSYCYNNLAGLNFSISRFDTALAYYQKSLAIREEINDRRGIVTSHANLAAVYVKQRNFDLASLHFGKALEGTKRSNDWSKLANLYESMGEMHLLTGHYAEAESALLKAAEYAERNRNRKLLQSINKYLSELENAKGNYKNALKYAELSSAYRDSIYTVEKALAIANTEARYESEKKDQRIQFLEQEQKISRLWTNIIVSGFGVILTALVVAYYVQKLHERKNRRILNLEIDNLTAQHKKLEEQYKNVLTLETSEQHESHDQRLLKKAIEVIEMNLQESSFGVEKMASEMAMSRTSMHRKIKAITGFPPSELIRNIRLRKAAALILNRVDTVSNISFMVGFEDQSYFSKSFKKQFGVPPTEYQQLKTNNTVTAPEVGELISMGTD